MTLNALWRLIRMLLVALGAPARAVVRLWRRDGDAMVFLAHFLELARKDGARLRRPGEDDSIVQARIDFLAWLSRDPLRAVIHMARRDRGWMRHRVGAKYAPVSWAPPVAGVVMSAQTMAAPVALTDSS